MKRIHYFSSLRVKLVTIAILLIMIPVFLISIYYSQTVKEIVNKKYTETAIQSVYEISENISFILNDVREFSTVIISDGELLEMLNSKDTLANGEVTNVLRGFITSRNDIEVIELAVNNQLFSIGARKLNNIGKIDSVLSESSGQSIWIPTENDTIEILSGEFYRYYFTLARKVIDYNTLKNYGYLMIDMDESILENAYKRLSESNDDGEIFICDSEGTIISHPDKKKIGSTIIYKDYSDIILKSSETSGYVEFEDVVDKVAIYSTINENGWKIIKTVPTSYLYEEINEIQKFINVGGFVYAMLIILFFIIFSIRYTEPMMKMMRVIEKVEQGDLSARTEIRSKDEVGQLGESLNNMIKEMENLIDKLIKEELEKKEVELEALHAQINPHFLYNTLNTIKWMAKIQGNSSVSRAITSLTKLLRISINLGRDKISLDEEIEYVKNYIVIQQLRFNELIHLDYEIQEECLDLYVPKLILQPIVENSIIYGITEENEEINIKIRCFIEAENLNIEVLDDGPGIERDILNKLFIYGTDKNKFSKVGLNNVNQRIKLYYGQEYGIAIESIIGVSTKVTVTLPATTN